MEIKIALAGNPNCGKTTVFNELTGNNQYVGNWPGVTVEKKEGYYKGIGDLSVHEIIVQDLPGIYSLSPYSPEEVVTRNYLINDKPDTILNVVDANNIERNLYLTTQLMEIGIPVVIAMNMMDVVRKSGDEIDTQKLSKDLGVPIIETSALKGEGLDEAIAEAVKASSGRQAVKSVLGGVVEHAIAHIEDIVKREAKDIADIHTLRWYSIKLFERDEGVRSLLKLSSAIIEEIEEIIRESELELDDDAESIITNERYNYIGKLTAVSVNKRIKLGGYKTSDKIDRIVTNRFLALPIFALIMFMVYFISVTTIGKAVTDFTNNVLLGQWIIEPLGNWLTEIGTAGWLIGLIVDGIVSGVGSVIGFVPQMLVLFLFLAVLEDIGYMARVAFIMDRIFRKLGLSGKSFIPMLVGSGCSVPGIMASRTIENERDRRMTIITTPFIPCGAKMPIIGVIAGVLLGGAWWVAPAAYFIGIGSVVVSGIILKKTRIFAGNPAPFVMELPVYHAPIVSNILRTVWDRGLSFVKRAGTVILLASIGIWFLSNFGFSHEGLTMVEHMDLSMLAVLGSFAAPLFAPLGFGSWQAAVATIMGLLAKEEVVGVFGVLFGVNRDVMELTQSSGFGEMASISSIFTSLSGFSFLVFNLLCAPCFAAMGAIRKEMNSSKWTAFAISYLCAFAYTVSLIIYQFGSFLTKGVFSVHTVAALVLLTGLLYLIFRRDKSKIVSYKIKNQEVNNNARIYN